MLITTTDQRGTTLHLHDAHITYISQSDDGAGCVHLTDGSFHHLPAVSTRDLIDALHPAKASSLAKIRRAHLQSLETVKSIAQKRRERNAQ
jgi:hypothetical protein